MDAELKDKRILIVFPGPELGGAERQGMHFARYLKRRGCEVHVWSTLTGHGKVVEECALEKFPWATHHFLWPCRKSSLIRDGWRLIRALRRLKPDVILSYTTSPNVGCGLFWRFSSAKVCIWGQRNTNDLRGDRIECRAYRRVSAVVCNARHEITYLEQALGKFKVPVYVVPNGLDLAPPLKNPEMWRRDLNIKKKSVIVVMLANFREQKDHFLLLHAWAELMSTSASDRSLPCLVLAGAPQYTFQEIKQLTEELEILDTVRFPGQVHDVSGLLASCDIGVLISKHEGLSNAVLEYMAAGLPVITTDLPGNREALGGFFEQQLCDVGNPISLAQKLQVLLHNSEIRKKLGERNKLRADNDFSIQAMCGKTVQIISDLMAKKLIVNEKQNKSR